MSIEIDLVWLLVTALGVFIFAFTAGKSKLKSLGDMVSCRLYITGLFLSIMLLFLAVLISEMYLPSWILLLLSKLSSMIVGTFLTVVVAKLILDISAGQVSLFSVRTFKGVLLILSVLVFVYFVNKLDSFYKWMPEYVDDSLLLNPSFSLAGIVLGWFTFFASLFIYIIYCQSLRSSALTSRYSRSREFAGSKRRRLPPLRAGF